MSKRILKGILVPNYKSSYAIESKIESVKDWHSTCISIGKDAPCSVITTNPEFGTESALIIFDKSIEPSSYDMDVEYIKTVIDDIDEARKFDIMDNVATESISIIDETSTDETKKTFIKSASKYLDKFAMEELTLLDLDVSEFIATEAVQVPDPQPAVHVEESEEAIESPTAIENEPSPEMEPTPKDDDVQVSVSEDGKQVEIVNISEDDALIVKEFIDGLKAMDMTVMDFLSTIKSIKAYMSAQAKVAEEPEEEPEGTETEEVATEDYTYQDAVPYPTRPGSEPQETTGGVSESIETSEETTVDSEVATESVDPYAGLDNEESESAGQTIAMENAPVEETPEPESNNEEVVESTPEDSSNETIATEAMDEPFINTLLKEANNDEELFELMMEHKDSVPKEILMESININMYEKLANNVIMSTTMVDRIKRGMRVNN